MYRNSKWFVVVGVTVLAFGLLFGTAMAHPGEPADDGVGGQGAYGPMNAEMYGQMIPHMTETHGAEFTAEMVQNMNGGNGRYGAGWGMMGAGGMNGDFMSGDYMNNAFMNGGMDAQSFGGAMNSVMRGVQGMMNGDFMNGDFMNNEAMGH